MKSVILLLVSIVFYFGCENPLGFPEGNSLEFPNKCYATRIIVKTNDGESCINAWAQIQDRKHFADTLGIIRGSFWTNDENPPSFIERTVRVYKNKNDNSKFWEGKVLFENTDQWHTFGSDLTSPPSEPSYPITEVIFPE